MEHRWAQEIPCTDGAGRHRTLTVYLSIENVIGIQVPPGETARLSVDDGAGALRDALAEAQVRQRGLR